MDFEALRTLFDLLAEKGIHEFEHEDENVRVRVVRGPITRHPEVQTAMLASSHPHAASPSQASVAPASMHAPHVDADVVEITSPFVGTFYRAASPDAPAFVDVGSVVRPGQALCIVEAMKLMNELESEVSGTVVEVLAQNGKAVEYGQKLFRIKKA